MILLLFFKGFAHNILSLVKLGLISTVDHPSLHPKGPDITWKEFMCDITHQTRDTYVDTVKSIVYDRLGRDDDQLATLEE